MTESSELWTFGTTPETVVLDWSEAWRASPLSAVIDLSDPDFRYIAEAVRFMRMAGLDMEDSAMLRRWPSTQGTGGRLLQRMMTSWGTCPSAAWRAVPAWSPPRMHCRSSTTPASATV